MSLKNQVKVLGAVIGMKLVAGTAMFNGTDTTGELDVAGIQRVQSAYFSIIRPTGSVQTMKTTAVSSTTTFNIVLPNVRGSISAIKITPASSVAASDTNYWTIGAINKGTDGTGVAVVVDNTAAANSTKATGGTAFTGASARTTTLTGVAGDKVVTEGQTIAITLTKTGSPDSLGAITIELDVTGAGIAGDEAIYVDELVNNTGQIEVDSTGKITVNRTGASPSNDLQFAYEVKGY